MPGRTAIGGYRLETGKRLIEISGVKICCGDLILAVSASNKVSLRSQSFGYVLSF